MDADTVWIEAGAKAMAELRDRFEERAAFMEYDAKLPREEAERLALLEIQEFMK